MKPLEFKIRRFNQLSPFELYDLLSLREKVFIVEQNCIYDDIDGKDQHALHLMGYQNGKMLAYARLFDAGGYFEERSIGRVLVHPEYRALKLGHQLMATAIETISETFGTGTIRISAQLYLKAFYETHGFRAEGTDYLEDGIPHIAMTRTAKAV